MDREHWKRLAQAIRRAVRVVQRSNPPPRRGEFSDQLIVSMYLWAVAHDRPQSWACDRTHYSGIFRPRQLPSVSWFNRRLRHERTRMILEQLHRELGGDLAATALSYLDGKPLLVGAASKDRDARIGHVMGGKGKGYKLHAWMSEDRRIPLWCVTPLNVGEPRVAQVLVSQQLTRFSERSLTLADQNYDSHALHKALAARNGRLLLPPKGEGKSLQQRHPVNLRKMGAARRELIAVSIANPSLMRMVYRQRVNAEGILGNLCGYGGGLTHLPPWVRGLERVRRWVGGKIILYHVRSWLRRQRKQAA
jgi:hypothetical protein